MKAARGFPGWLPVEGYPVTIKRSRRAAEAFGAALAMGAAIGAAFAFFVVLAGLKSASSALPDVESWLGSLGVSSVAAFVGGIAGALTGAGAWFVAAMVLLLIDLRRRALPISLDPPIELRSLRRVKPRMPS